MRRKVLMVLGIAFVSGLLLVGGYLLQGARQEPEIAYSGPCDPRIPFTTLTDEEWGYSISYPESWFIERYRPLDNPAVSAADERADPSSLPYYMLTISTSEGDHQDGGGEEIARVSLVRKPFDQTFDFETFLDSLQRSSEEFGLGLAYSSEPVIVSGISGFAMQVSGRSEGWITRVVFLESSDYSYELRGSALVGISEEACSGAVERIQSAFRFDR